jgi:glycosyltransferase involved in cell wall biosynthesis
VRACINSQTPFIRFRLTNAELLAKYGSLPDPVDVGKLEEGVDYEFSPGGVTAMVYPLVRRMMKQHYLTEVIWVSLGIKYPPRVRIGDILVNHVEVPRNTLRDYTAFKESLWSQIHGLPGEEISDRRYEGYARFNWANSEMLLKHWKDVDVFYVQDFQLLMTGGVIGPPAPAVLRWHVPFKPDNLSVLTHRAILKWMEGFDGIVVSTRRDLEGLIKSSYRGRAHQAYPFVDPADWEGATQGKAVQALTERVGLEPDDKLLLMVARMDRMKSHDIAIQAMASIKKRGSFRLALIGNGSFSSSTKGGLGHGKGGLWKAELQRLVRKLHLEDSVTFLGHVTREELRAAYSLSSAVLLTSRLEGFGITVLEAWMNKKPVVVSKGAGASELVVDGSNGFTFNPVDAREAGEKLMKAVGEEGEKCGENGFETAKQCHIDVAVEREKEILEDAISIYK